MLNPEHHSECLASVNQLVEISFGSTFLGTQGRLLRQCSHVRENTRERYWGLSPLAGSPSSSSCFYSCPLSLGVLSSSIQVMLFQLQLCDLKLKSGLGELLRGGRC